MDLFTIISILMVLVSIFAYINSLFLKLQTTIGTMIISIVFSLGILGLSKLFPELIKFEKDIVGTIDFKNLLMEGLLCFMLFAGAVHVNITELKSQRWKIVAFSSLGVVISTFLIGGIFFLGFATNRYAFTSSSLFIVRCPDFSNRPYSGYGCIKENWHKKIYGNYYRRRKSF
ncbi:cation:proton antiporter domain-containing protein [Zobellia nedashkovskayae]